MSKKILFVDDESSLRRTMALGLQQHGYETEPCENGLNALKKIESYIKNKIQLDGIVVDLRLPDIDGAKLVKIMKFKCPGVPIIVITGYADRYDMEEIRDLQVNAFMEKPFSTEELMAQFAQVLSSQASPSQETEPETEESPVQSAYVLLRLDEDNRNFFETFREIYHLKQLNGHMVYCDATKGDYDIFLLLQAESMETLKNLVENNIKTIAGVRDAEFLAVSRPVLSDTTLSVIKDAEEALEEDAAPKTRDMSHRLCSYVLMEVEKEKMDAIYPTLRLDENVVYCDYAAGKYNLVLLVVGAHFDEIDRFIQQKVITLDGVLRVKEYPIINLFEM